MRSQISTLVQEEVAESSEAVEERAKSGILQQLREVVQEEIKKHDESIVQARERKLKSEMRARSTSCPAIL